MAFNPYYSFTIPGYWELIIYALLAVAIFVGGPFVIAWLAENLFQQ